MLPPSYSGDLGLIDAFERGRPLGLGYDGPAPGPIAIDRIESRAINCRTGRR